MSLKSFVHNYTLKNDVRILDKKLIYDGFIKLKRLKIQYRLFSKLWSQNIVREVTYRDPASAVVLFNPWKQAVLLTEQFRIGTISDTGCPWLVELVAGMIDNGETPEQAAIRETKEEAGVSILDLRFICKYWASPGISNEFVYLFCACIEEEAPTESLGKAEEGEDIRVTYWPIQEVFKAVQSGIINNAPAIIGLQWLQINHESLSNDWINLKN